MVDYHITMLGLPEFWGPFYFPFHKKNNTQIYRSSATVPTSACPWAWRNPAHGTASMYHILYSTFFTRMMHNPSRFTLIVFNLFTWSVNIADLRIDLVLAMYNFVHDVGNGTYWQLPATLFTMYSADYMARMLILITRFLVHFSPIHREWNWRQHPWELHNLIYELLR
jgi:hypothetical protein